MTLIYSIDCRFVRLPVVLYELKQIQEILVNDNQLIELDAIGLQKIAGTLLTLNVRNNNLQRLPAELCKCTLLKSLDVAGESFHHRHDYSSKIIFDQL